MLHDRTADLGEANRPAVGVAVRDHRLAVGVRRTPSIGFTLHGVVCTSFSRFRRSTARSICRLLHDSFDYRIRETSEYQSRGAGGAFGFSSACRVVVGTEHGGRRTRIRIT